MHKKLTVLFSLIMVFSILLSACASATAPAQPEATTAPEQPAAVKPITIGMGAILTGSDTYIHGELISKSAQLAIDEINAKGGVLGRPLALKIVDDGGDPKQAVNIAHSFCSDPEISAVLVDPYSGMAFAAMPVYNDCGMPMINHGSNPLVTEMGFEGAIQSNPNDLITGQAAADYAWEKMGVKSVAILHNKSLWGAGVASVFRLRAEQLGMKVTSYQGIDPTDVDFTPVLTKIKEENPDALYFAGYVEQGLMRKQMVQLGMSQKFIAGEATSSEYIDIVKDAGVGTVTATGAPPLDFRPEIIAFDEKFFAKYDKHPETWAPYYYDRVYAYADIITKANSDKREDIVKQMHNVDITSIIYPQGLQVDAHGRVVHPVTFVYELQPDLKYKLMYVWEGEPPYATMSEEEYAKLIESLK